MPSRSPIARASFALIAAAAGASPALAQQSPVDPATGSRATPAPRSETGPLDFKLNAGGTYTFQSDIDDSNADVSSARTDLGFNIGWNAAETLRFDLLIDGELSFYDWNNAAAILPGASEPFDDLFSTGLSLGARWRFSDPWSLAGGVFVRSGWESGADLADGITVGGFGAVGYQFTPNFSVLLGAGVTSRLDDNITPFPFIGFRWFINDKLRLTSRGLGLDLTYSVSDEFDVTLGGGLDRREYRLTEDHGALPDGVVRADRVPIGVEFAWKPVEGLKLALTGGALVYQHFEFLNENGGEVLEIETDPAAFVGVRVEWSF